ncbi:MAG: histidyl-tRNA synthetase, partial [Planctomycetota bacterium]
MAKRTVIQPRTLKGFRDYLPEIALPREQLIDTAKGVYRSFGFAPIDTPALEYSEILLGKGGAESDKQMFRFEDHGGRDVALRFDLTIPLARFVAQHSGQLGMPFKRYHVGPVWRGENTQRGRYREFIQCDFDTIGTKSPVADVESALVIQGLFEALGFERFVLRVNHRGVLTGVLERVGLADQAVPVLRALDKLAKIGPAKVAEEMQREAGASESQAKDVLTLAEAKGSNAELLDGLPAQVAGSEAGEAGVESLNGLLAGLAAAGIPEERVALDLSIARGLDYYTGVIFETFLGDLPGIGSCCSGGRYDDLASVYTKEVLPGVGASLGVDRLLAAMEELGLVEGRSASAPVLLTYFDKARGQDYVTLAAKLRAQGLGVELYPDAKKLGAQLKYADRRGHSLAIIVGEDEWQA